MRKLIFLIPLLLEGCGVFRTAEVLKPGEQVLDINSEIYPSGNGNNVGYFPAIHYRRGINNGDWGIKLYCLGIEGTFCAPLAKEARWNPALAAEVGIGTVLYMPTYGQLNLITSKHIGIFNIYGGGQLTIVPAEEHLPLLKRFFGGVNIGHFFLEASYGDWYQFEEDSPSEILPLAAYGFGARAFSWGGKKPKVQEKRYFRVKQ